MDITNAYTQAGITSSILFLGGLGYKIYLVINHKRCRSSCCGRQIEASFDVEETTPPRHDRPEIFIQNPLRS
tara:strand:- start:379 stop:594 length:216 start_codon:yes stop_codon:yes gene_type:complete